jgi:hypothetical protein
MNSASIPALAQSSSGPLLPDVELLEVASYFFVNSWLIMAAAALIFGGLGLWLGYLTWAKFKRRARAFQEECVLLRTEIAALKRRIAEEAAPPLVALPVDEEMPSMFRLSLPLNARVTVVEEEEVEAKPAQLEPAVVAELQEGTAETKPALTEPLKITQKNARVILHEMQVPGAVKPELAIKLSEPAAKTTSMAKTTARTLIIDSQAQAEPSTENLRSGQTSRILLVEKVIPEVDQVDIPVEEVKAPEKEPEAAPKIAEPVVVAESPTPSILLQNVAIVSETVAQVAMVEGSTDPAPFAAELYAGRGVLHSHLGFVYQQRPERYDDLTLIRNVADKMQNRLNEIGVYTFRQIALWSTDQLVHVAQKVKAKDRILKEQWQVQARKLHQLKYGEALAAQTTAV